MSMDPMPLSSACTGQISTLSSFHKTSQLRAILTTLAVTTRVLTCATTTSHQSTSKPLSTTDVTSCSSRFTTSYARMSIRAGSPKFNSLRTPQFQWSNLSARCTPRTQQISLKSRPYSKFQHSKTSNSPRSCQNPSRLTLHRWPIRTMVSNVSNLSKSTSMRTNWLSL